MIDLLVGSMSKDELNLPEGLKMSLISRHTLLYLQKHEEETRETTIAHVAILL
jgi:hypothetical protein